MYDQDYNLTECDAVRCGTDLLRLFKKKRININIYIYIYIYIYNCMRYADLKAIGINILELVYVALYRLVTKVSEKFNAFLSKVQGFFVGSSPPKEVALPTKRHENQKSPDYMFSHDKSANSLYLPRLLAL